MIIMTFGIMMKIIIGIITSIATASVTSKSAKVIVNNSSNNNNRDRIETKLNANESHPRKKILRMQHFKYKKKTVFLLWLLKLFVAAAVVVVVVILIAIVVVVVIVISFQTFPPQFSKDENGDDDVV